MKVQGNSMLPSFKPGQFIVVSPLPYLRGLPKVNDVVVLKKNERTMIKRISQIEHDSYFVLGDNAKESTDSRSFGLVDRTCILAKVLF